MNKLIFILLLTSCSTLPTGELVNQDTLKRDIDNQSKQTEENLNISKGRPIYVRAHAYPQIIAGKHVFLGSDVLINIGREELTLKQMLQR